MTVALACWTVGDLIWSVWLDHIANPPVPSVADLAYLLMYPAMYAALMVADPIPEQPRRHRTVARRRRRGAGGRRGRRGAGVRGRARLDHRPIRRRCGQHRLSGRRLHPADVRGHGVRAGRPAGGSRLAGAGRRRRAHGGRGHPLRRAVGGRHLRLERLGQRALPGLLLSARGGRLAAVEPSISADAGGPRHDGDDASSPPPPRSGCSWWRHSRRSHLWPSGWPPARSRWRQFARR